MNIWILDNQYWEKIYNWLSKVLTDCNFPVKNNVENPVLFGDNIQDWDIILLDNYFPWKTR